MENSLQTIFIICIFSTVYADHWTYDKQDSWPDKCLSGRYQSPINLDKDNCQRKDFHYFNFQMKNYKTKYVATLVNNGHAIAINFKFDGSPPTMRGAGFEQEYTLDHIHFHWGSEHTVHDNRYPLEAHFVHYGSKFNGTGAAAGARDGLAVLGVLFDISDDDNPAMEPIISHIEKVQKNLNTPVNLPKDIVPAHFLPKDTETYFRYPGSLTTPGCNEAVVWTVFYHTVPISKAQVAKFPTINSADGPLTANYRKIQPLNDRIVTFKTSNMGVSHGVSFVLITMSMSLYLNV